MSERHTSHNCVLALFATTALLVFVSSPLFANDPWQLKHTFVNPNPSFTIFSWGADVDQEMVIVGSAYEEKAYQYDAQSGDLVRTFEPPPGDSNGLLFGLYIKINDRFIVISRDGHITYSGKVYVYDRDSGSLLWTLQNPNGTPRDRFGTGIDLKDNLLVVSAPGAIPSALGGEVFLFNLDDGSFVRQFHNPNPNPDDKFGQSVSVEGDYLAVGADQEDAPESQSGIAYLFQLSTGNLVRTFLNPNSGANYYFGRRVDIKGNYLAVSSHWSEYPPDNDAQGAVYVFNALTGELVSSIFPPDDPGIIQFGYQIQIADELVYVGHGADRDDGNSGDIYTYDLYTAELVGKISNPSPDLADQFGINFSITDKYALASATRDDTVGLNSGQAYLFELPPKLSCSGFYPPMEKYPVKAKKNRVFPLKMELFDSNGFEVEGPDLASPPVVQVMFYPADSEPAVDISGDALSTGQRSEGNQFLFGDQGIWRFNLSSRSYSANGEYLVTALSGDETEYVIDPECVTSFTIN